MVRFPVRNKRDPFIWNKIASYILWVYVVVWSAICKLFECIPINKSLFRSEFQNQIPTFLLMNVLCKLWSFYMKRGYLTQYMNEPIIRGAYVNDCVGLINNWLSLLSPSYGYFPIFCLILLNSACWTAIYLFTLKPIVVLGMSYLICYWAEGFRRRYSHYNARFKHIPSF